MPRRRSTGPRTRANEARDEECIPLLATALEQEDGDGVRVMRGASVDEMIAALATEAAEEECG